jgi:hypothetical protein
MAVGAANGEASGPGTEPNLRSDTDDQEPVTGAVV